MEFEEHWPRDFKGEVVQMCGRTERRQVIKIAPEPSVYTKLSPRRTLTFSPLQTNTYIFANSVVQDENGPSLTSCLI